MGTIANYKNKDYYDASYIDDSGKVNYGGCAATFDDKFVRPAIWISLSNTER